MAQMIRPVSDLRNNFADISKTVHETKKPVFLTKNGFGDMVVLSRIDCCPDSRNSKYSAGISGTETKRRRAGG